MVVASSSNLNLTCLLRISLIAYPVHTLVPKTAPQKESTATLSRPALLFWLSQMFHSITGLMLSKPPHFSSIECPPPSSIIYLPTVFIDLGKEKLTKKMFQERNYKYFFIESKGNLQVDLLSDFWENVLVGIWSARDHFISLMMRSVRWSNCLLIGLPSRLVRGIGEQRIGRALLLGILLLEPISSLLLCISLLGRLFIGRAGV